MKILTIHATAGAGHMMAARAVYDGLKKYTDHEAHIVDALDHTSPLFKKLYKGTYSFMISKIPPIWAFFFALLDIPVLQPAIRKARRIYNTINGRRLHEFLIKEQFDMIISAHFMPTEVAAALKREGKINSKLMTIVTDFDVHKIWLAEGVDHYCVACDWTKDKLASLGVDVFKITATGIPTNEKFSQHPDTSMLKGKLGVVEDMFTVLIATGSFGIGPIEAIVDQLDGFQVIVVCGHNKGLFQRLMQKRKEHVKVFGLVDNMDELMAASDVMVTKPGGLSINEALVSQLPLIFFNAIPGQEEGNVRVLNANGIGFMGKSVPEIAEELIRLKSSKDAFVSCLKKTQALARPFAVRDIVSLVK